MRKIVAVLLVGFVSLNALETSDKLFECTEIFKARKSELLIELERIDEQKQSLSALKTATEELLNKREAKLSEREASVTKQHSEISAKEESIKKMVQKNEQILKELKETKMGKMAETFAKMKAANAATVLSEMDAKDAVEILSSLKPKTTGTILSKMESKKASELTILLAK
ncbi:MAG: PDP protein [Sulfurimonas sp.]|nr:PDP protein [Sulfurimonas sp.]